MKLLKSLPKIVLILTSLLVLTTATLSPIHTSAAGSATMYLSPASGSYKVGDTMTVAVYENSGVDTVSAAEARLSYPASLLSYQSVNSSGAFNISAPTSGGGGTVVLPRGAQPAVSGVQIIGYVVFKVLATGNATISINSDSSVISAVDATTIPSSKTGATFSLTPAPTPPAPTPPAPTPPAPKPISTPAPTPAPASKPSSTASPAPATPPTTSSGSFEINNIVVSGVSYNSATVTWHTSVPATTELYYGQGGNYSMSKIDEAMVSDHSVTLSLSAGQLYHYIIKGRNAAGQTSSTSDGTLHTKGATVVLTVLDSNNKPVKGATVTIKNGSKDLTVEEYTAITDANGIATLKDLPVDQNSPQVLAATVSYGGKTYAKEVQVQPLSTGNTSQTKSVSIPITTSVIKPLYIYISLAGLGLLAVAFVYRLVSIHRSKANDINHHFPNLPGTPPSGSGGPVPPTVYPPSGYGTTSSSVTDKEQ